MTPPDTLCRSAEDRIEGPDRRPEHDARRRDRRDRGWFLPAAEDAGVDGSDVEDALREQREAADALLLGRVTFEQFRSHWPNRSDDTTGISAYLDAVAEHVASRRLQDPGWEHTSVLRGELAHEVRALKARPGRDIVTTGSIDVVHQSPAAMSLRYRPA